MLYLMLVSTLSCVHPKCERNSVLLFNELAEMMLFLGKSLPLSLSIENNILRVPHTLGVQ